MHWERLLENTEHVDIVFLNNGKFIKKDEKVYKEERGDLRIRLC